MKPSMRSRASAGDLKAQWRLGSRSAAFEGMELHEPGVWPLRKKDRSRSEMMREKEAAAGASEQMMRKSKDGSREQITIFAY